MLISIHRTVQGREYRHDFKFHDGSALWVYVCNRCGRTHSDALTPVDLVDDSEEQAVYTGQTLCEYCCKEPDIGDGWPGLTLTQMRELWALVRKEQAREATNETARERAVATCLQELQASTAALQQDIAAERVNDVGKVA